MSSIALKISKKQYLQLVVPKEKENLYYEPTDKLHRFDLVKVFYVENENNHFILEDALMEIVLSFVYKTELVLKNSMEIGEHIIPGKFGLFYNEKIKNDTLWKERDIFKYLLFKGLGVQMAIYTCNGLIYIEAFPSFRPNSNRSDEENLLNLNKFMDTYVPIGIMTLDKNTLEKWRKQFKEFFELEDDAIPY